MQAELEEQQQRKHEAALTDQVHPLLLRLRSCGPFHSH